MLCFCGMGPEAVWPVVYAMVVFASLYCNFRLGCLRLIFTKAFIEEFTSFIFSSSYFTLDWHVCLNSSHRLHYPLPTKENKLPISMGAGSTTG